MFRTLSALFLMGCVEPTAVTEPTEPGEPTVPATATAPPLPELVCEASQTVSNGTLCALRPSLLDAATRDVFGPGVNDARIGLGLHVVAVPDVADPTLPLWVHIGGTYGRPYDPEDGTIAADTWLNELLGHGYTVVQPAYVNRNAVNDDCGAAGPGRDRDDCAGEVREEVLTGVDHSPYRDVSPADSFDHRLNVLLDHLQTVDVPLPESLDPTTMRLSGHSQGGNLAYYLARFRGVDHACMLAAPYDSHDTVDPSLPPIADWFARGTSLTPVDRLGQVLATEDDTAQAFRGGAAFIGLVVGEHAFEVTAAPYQNAAGEEVNGHAAPLADPSLAPERALACIP